MDWTAAAIGILVLATLAGINARLTRNELERTNRRELAEAQRVTQLGNHPDA